MARIHTKIPSGTDTKYINLLFALKLIFPIHDQMELLLQEPQISDQDFPRIKNLRFLKARYCWALINQNLIEFFHFSSINEPLSWFFLSFSTRLHPPASHLILMLMAACTRDTAKKSHCYNFLQEFFCKQVLTTYNKNKSKGNRL